jgi:iron complex transport system substrate-binding protein
MKKPLVILAVIFVPIVVAAVSILVNHPSKSKVGNRKSEIRRIVSLSPNLTEIVFTLGLGGKVVAVSSNCDWPAETRAKPKVGSFWQPNTEAIIAAKPDLVVCESFEQQRAVGETLKRAGLNVLSLRIESIDELFAAISQIGRAAGCGAAAGQIIADTKERLDQIREMCSPAKKVKVLWVIQTEPLRLAGVNTFINEIIELAGGQNAIALTVDQYPSVGTEDILICGAEVIIQTAMGIEDIDKQRASAERFWSRFASLPAVKNKRIYVIDSDTVLRLGPRLPEGAQAIAQCLHPELFTQPQTTSLQKEL